MYRNCVELRNAFASCPQDDTKETLITEKNMMNPCFL